MISEEKSADLYNPHVIYKTLSGSSQLRLSMADEQLARITREADLDTAADSGYGHSSYGSSSSGYGHYCPEGIPVETALFAVLAAAGLSFGALFMTVTMITGARRKRKRRSGEAESSLHQIHQISGDDDSPFKIFSTFIWEGMLSFLHSRCRFFLCFYKINNIEIVIISLA